MEEARRELGDVPGMAFGTDLYNVAEGADALLLLTEWKAFRSPDLQRLRDTLRGLVIFDGRNVFDPELVSRNGFDYYSIGRPPILTC